MKKILTVLLTVLLSLSLISCNSNTTNTSNEQLEKEMGAFEITAIQRELAKENELGYSVLDAGRGNPNWINTKSRYAFIRLEEFALKECEATYNNEDMAGQAKLDGIGKRYLYDLCKERSRKTCLN